MELLWIKTANFKIDVKVTRGLKSTRSGEQPHSRPAADTNTPTRASVAYCEKKKKLAAAGSHVSHKTAVKLYAQAIINT